MLNAPPNFRRFTKKKRDESHPKDLFYIASITLRHIKELRLDQYLNTRILSNLPRSRALAVMLISFEIISDRRSHRFKFSCLRKVRKYFCLEDKFVLNVFVHDSKIPWVHSPNQRTLKKKSSRVNYYEYWSEWLDQNFRFQDESNDLSSLIFTESQHVSARTSRFPWSQWI